VIVAVAGTVIVAVHVHGNAPVGVIAGRRRVTPLAVPEFSLARD
jgi:hypothetical protein